MIQPRIILIVFVRLLVHSQQVVAASREIWERHLGQQRYRGRIERHINNAAWEWRAREGIHDLRTYVPRALRSRRNTEDVRQRLADSQTVVIYEKECLVLN